MSGIESLDDLDEGALGELFRQMRLEDLVKASFGGDRSAAGRYAAEQRWKGHVKREDKPSDRSRGSLDDEVARASGMLQSVANLPEVEYEGLMAVVITADEYDSYDKAQFVWVKGKGGKTHLVVTKAVMEAEAAVRAVGAKALQQVHQELVASGAVSQKDLDDATMFMSRTEAPKDDRSAVEKIMERAMAGDTSLPAQVLEEARAVQHAMERHKETKGDLIRATRAYNKFVEEGSEIRRSGRELTDEEIQSRKEMERQLWLERRAAKAENNNAKTQLRLAERNMELWAQPQAEVETQVTDFKEQARLKENAIRVQGLVGERFKEMLAGRRAMPNSVPMRDIIVPTTLTIVNDGKQIDPDARARDILAETRRRFPQEIMNRLDRVDTGQGGVKIEFTGRGGGSYNPLTHRIQSDANDSDTLTHEMVHGISYNSRETRLMEQAALQRRVFGRVDQPNASFSEKLRIGLQKVVGATKALGYRMEGAYVEDKFVSGYQGRMYDYQARRIRGRGVPKSVSFTGATEILTVSTENAFGGGSVFRGRGKLDVELLELSMGWLLSAEGGK